MDRNRTEGAKNQVKGAVKEVVGKVTGNTLREVEGKLQKDAGEVIATLARREPTPAAEERCNPRLSR